MHDGQIAAIYCRLSKEDSDKTNIGDDSESIQNQKLMLLDYALEKGFLVHNVYVDEDLSGFSERPAFKQMIKDAANGLFNTIICKHQSRFTRDMELVEKYIHGYFVEWGIRFISLTDNVDTNVKGNKKARQIYGLINEWHSEDLSENIKAVFRKKMEAGQYLGAFAAYGYKKCPENRHKLIIDEEAADVVREIFCLYLEGNGTNSIAAKLTLRNTLTPTQYKKSKGLNFNAPNTSLFSEKYGAWSMSTIKRILQNEVYIGTLIQNREKKVSYKSKKVVTASRSDWIVLKDNHEKIVDENVFARVQKIMSRNRRDSTIKQKAQPHILAGKVICADCGSTMERGGRLRDGVTYYIRCKLSSKTRGRDCTPHSIRQDKLEGLLLTKIQGLLLSVTEKVDVQNVLDDVLRQTEGANPATTLTKQISDIDVKIAAIKKKIVNAYKDKLDNIINEEDYIMFRTSFDDELKAFEKSKGHLETELEAFKVRQADEQTARDLFNKYKTMNKLTHQIVNDFVDTILVGEKNPETSLHEISIKWLF